MTLRVALNTAPVNDGHQKQTGVRRISFRPAHLDVSAIIFRMDKFSHIIDKVEEQVGHAVRLETRDGDLLGHERVEPAWRVLPVEPMAVHEFILWHQSCARQWFETPEEAAAEYCAKWEEWSTEESQPSEVDYGTDSIEYTP